MAYTRRRSVPRYRPRPYNPRYARGEDSLTGVTVVQILITVCVVSALYLSTLWDGAAARYIGDGARAVFSENIEVQRALEVMASLSELNPVGAVADYLMPRQESDAEQEREALGEAILTQSPETSLPIYESETTESEDFPSAGQVPDDPVSEGTDALGSGGMLVMEENSLAPPDSVLTTPVYLSVRLNTPVAGTVTSPFGFRSHPITGKRDFHLGIDIAANKGTDVLAALQGVVAEVGTSAIYGEYVVLEHGGGVKTSYSHCNRIVAREGQRVGAGARIATVGSTGISTGSHLHFELIVGGLRVDPLPHLKTAVVSQ